MLATCYHSPSPFSASSVLTGFSFLNNVMENWYSFHKLAMLTIASIVIVTPNRLARLMLYPNDNKAAGKAIINYNPIQEHKFIKWESRACLVVYHVAQIGFYQFIAKHAALFCLIIECIDNISCKAHAEGFAVTPGFWSWQTILSPYKVSNKVRSIYLYQFYSVKKLYYIQNIVIIIACSGKVEDIG